MGQDLRGEGRLAGAALDVQVRSVAQGVDSSICAAGDDKLDRQDRVQPLCGLLWGQSGAGSAVRTRASRDRPLAQGVGLSSAPPRGRPLPSRVTGQRSSPLSSSGPRRHAGFL